MHFGEKTKDCLWLVRGNNDDVTQCVRVWRPCDMARRDGEAVNPYHQAELCVPRGYPVLMAMPVTGWAHLGHPMGNECAAVLGRWGRASCPYVSCTAAHGGWQQ